MTNAPTCSDCGLSYDKIGVDLVLPDQQWSKLAPEGGVLCANCICKRATKFGATAILCWINNFDYQLRNSESVSRPSY